MNGAEKESTQTPVLTIAIPTFNRAGYLEQNLEQLRSEMTGVPETAVEILVSDNCSPDSTPQVVENARAAGLRIEYIRNESNLGWGPNFAQCFTLARGNFVLLLGDDDLLVDGALQLLLDRLVRHQYGVVSVRPYGFDSDFRQEYPGGDGEDHTYGVPDDFLVAIGPLMTLTSSNVINKRRLPGFNFGNYVSGDLAALPLVLRAALASDQNLFIDRYLIASKRNNSFNYEYSKVFVDEMWRIIDDQVPEGLSRAAIKALENDMLFSYYPFYLLDLRLHRRSDPRLAQSSFARRFKGRFLYDYWVAPILRLPRPAGLVWGGITTFVGRALGGDFRRGVMFAWSRLRAVASRALPSRL